MRGLWATALLAVLATGAPAWALGGGCIAPDSQQGVLLQPLVDQLAAEVEAARAAGEHARVIEAAAEARATRLCGIPASIDVAEAEALVATGRACEAGPALDGFFARRVPGDVDYDTAERLFEQVRQARDAGLCVEHVGGVALAEPAAAAPERAPFGGEASEDGSHRDAYRGGELNEGRMAFASGNHARAAELFGKVIEQAPGSFEGWFRRAQAYARLGRDAEAEADFLKAVELGEGRGYIVVEFARFLADRQRDADALAVYTAYLDRHPNDVGVLRERAALRRKAGLVELALEDYDRAIRLAPGDAGLLLQRAFVYHDNGMFEQAARDYTAIVALGRATADTYYRRGLAHYALNRVDEAIADFDAALAADPGLAEAYRGRGRLYQYRGDGAAAIADFTRLIELKPNDAEAYVDRAQEHQRRLDADRALADYGEALRIDPGNLEALKGRAIVYQQQGRNDLALADLSRIIDRDYADADAYARRGWAYYGGRDYRLALEDFDRALLVDPGNRQAQLGRQASLEAIAAEEKAAAEAARKRR
jgi:tetratricopeptide (TPR) repeat protein